MIEEIENTILVEETEESESPKRDSNFGLYNENGEMQEEKTEE